MVVIRTLWLQVAVDEAHQMQILERSCDLGGVKARCILVYALVRPGLEGSEELAATAVLHAEIEMIFGLKRVVQSNNKGVIAGGQNLLLGECTLNLVTLNHLLLAQHCDASVTQLGVVMLGLELTLHSIQPT